MSQTFSLMCALAATIVISVAAVESLAQVAPSESVDDIGQGKEKAEDYARVYLKQAADLELRPLRWKKSRSA